MGTPAQAIETYIRGKDENRPHFLRKAFAEDAAVLMVVNSANIAFPPTMTGVDAIVDGLVRQFGKSFENVYTFCLSPRPDQSNSQFSCPWLVGMSDKHSGAVRVGSGLYEWVFSQGHVRKLTITITVMETLEARALDPVMRWLGSLPYPWCPPDTALREAPQIAELKAVFDHIKKLASV